MKCTQVDYLYLRDWLYSILLGNYNGKQCHVDDSLAIIERAQSVGVKTIICTAGSVKESEELLKFCRRFPIEFGRTEISYRFPLRSHIF